MTIFQKLWSLLPPADRRRAIVVLGLMLVGVMLETLGVGLVIPAIALLTQKDLVSNYPTLQPILRAMGDPSDQTLIIGGMLTLVGVYVVKSVFLALLAWRQMHFAFGVQAHLSSRLFSFYLHQPYSFHLQKNSAQLLRNVITEVNLFTGNGLIPGMAWLAEVLVLCGLSILLLIIEPRGALIAGGMLGAAAWSFHSLSRNRVTRWGKARQHHEGLRVQHLQQGLGGVKDVKLLGREADFLQQYQLHNVLSTRMGRLYVTMQQLPRLWLEFLAVTGLAILVITMVMQNRALETVLPTLGLFAAAAFRLMPSINRILSANQALRYGLPAIDVLYSELQQIPASVGKAAHTDFSPFLNTLELCGVTYSYPGTVDPALRDISITVQRGETAGFIGTSGAGKSTLVDILLGLLPPGSGKVQMDGRDIQNELRNWQNQIGYVPQSIFFTDDTVRRNVAFGLPDHQIDDAAVWRAVCAAQLDEFVRNLPEGLDTVVGERGVRLSGGQRQRIGIARALYHDPAVLVLDEATSALDTATEREVMEVVAKMHGEKTVIIVAHRLSTVEHCDRLYRLEKGRVIEEGTPASMLPVQTVGAI